MKILFLVENYKQFYTKYLSAHPELQKAPYEKQCLRLFEQQFYQSDSYAYGMRELGHEASQLIIDCYHLQHKWAKELSPFRFYVYPLRRYLKRMLKQPFSIMDQIALEQIKRIHPDIIYVFSGVPVNKTLLSEAKRYARYLICQWSCPIIEGYPYDSYDLIITSTKALVEYFGRAGYNVAYLPHAFDERVLNKINGNEPRDRAVFIGTVYEKIHLTRLELLDYLSHHIDFDFYGEGIERFAKDSPIHMKYLGEVVGLEMYRIYSRSKIAIHMHPAVTGQFVGAKRLFEVTGAGAMLLTDAKRDLNEFFDGGKEVIAYTDPGDCLDKLRYYLAHDNERSSIARAGQARTLRCHTFQVRMKELVDIFEKKFQLK